MTEDEARSYFTEVPPELKVIEDQVCLGSGDGGFRLIEGNRLLWFNSWIGDAPGDNPRDETWFCLCLAMQEIAQFGYVVGDLYNEHDHASFTIHRKDPRYSDAE